MKLGFVHVLLVIGVLSAGQPHSANAIWRGHSSKTVVSGVCRLVKSAGPCRAMFQRWFYNMKSGECESFTYGGCRGNGNNFQTKAACEKQCKASVGNQHVVPGYQLSVHQEHPVGSCTDCKAQKATLHRLFQQLLQMSARVTKIEREKNCA